MTLRRSDDPLDTYLLRIFVLLITERSVSRTALRMNQSQPAVSAALKRLREILGDPLLVREKGGMVPTERALALMSHAKGALAEIDLAAAFADLSAEEGWCCPEVDESRAFQITAGRHPVVEARMAETSSGSFIVAKPLSPSLLLKRIIWLGGEDRDFVEAEISKEHNA